MGFLYWSLEGVFAMYLLGVEVEVNKDNIINNNNNYYHLSRTYHRSTPCITTFRFLPRR